MEQGGPKSTSAASDPEAGATQAESNASSSQTGSTPNAQTSVQSEGAGGNAGAGGSSGGASGAPASAGGSGEPGVWVDPRTLPEAEQQALAEACLAYSLTHCERSAECHGSSVDFGQCIARCPDLVFSPGSTRTAATLHDCAERYRALSCEDFIAGVIPDCVTPGTRQLGEACSFSSQCESLFCDYPDPQGDCGQCGVATACGELLEGCDADSRCINDTCLQLNSKAIGDSCEISAECIGPDATCQSGQCAQLPAENEACVGNRCGGGLYCAASDQVCRPRPVLGEACADDAASGWVCASGLRCTARNLEPAGTCVEPVAAAVGDSCSAPQVSCPNTSLCLCLDAECSARQCLEPRLPGDACSDQPGEQCAASLACVAGVCSLPTYAGVFEASCTP